MCAKFRLSAEALHDFDFGFKIQPFKRKKKHFLYAVYTKN